MDEPDVGIDKVDWSRACDGDGAAFAAIYDRYVDRLLSYALRSTGSWPSAEDAVSASFLEVWRRRADVRFDETGSIAGWLFATTRNVLRNQSRALRRHRASIDRVHRDAASPDPSEQVVAQLSAEQEVESIRWALGTLTKRDREALSLAASGLEPREIAQVLGTTSETARSRLARGRKRMTALRPLAPEPREIVIPARPSFSQEP